MPNTESFLTPALEAAHQACRVIMQVYEDREFDVQLKEDRSPLTKADQAAHEVILSRLKETGLPILSEEGVDMPYDVRRSWNTFWLVDPLDGTKEFIKRNGEFTVNIALVHQGIPVLGVIAVPARDERVYSVSGQGAFFVTPETTRKLELRQPVALSQAGLRVVASRSHMNQATEDFIGQLKNPMLISAGSSLKFLALAQGTADLYPRFIPCMEWDTAAADAILREVGLRIIDVTTGEPLRYNKASLLNNSFICGGHY